MRKFWKHEHKPWREHTPSCASPVTGAAITPVAFRWCKCGEEIDSVLTPVGQQLVAAGFTKDELCELAAGSYWTGASADSHLPLPPYRPGGPFYVASPSVAWVGPPCTCSPECVAISERQRLEREHALNSQPSYPRPDPGHKLWCVDLESCCPACSGQRWENIGTHFTNRWLCLDCGWTTSGWPTSANVERPRRPT